MKKIVLGLGILLALLATPAFAADSQPSEASVRRLLDITRSKSMLEGAFSQMETMMASSLKQATAGQELTPEQLKIMEDLQAKINEALREEMTWASMEPVFIDIYRQSFSQKEVDGMLTFYKSSAGQAVIAKMPLVMQNTMQAMQQRMLAFLPKVQKLTAESMEKLKNATPQHPAE